MEVFRGVRKNDISNPSKTPQFSVFCGNYTRCQKPGAFYKNRTQKQIHNPADNAGEGDQMKNAIVTLMVVLASHEAAANRWPDGEITVVIDSSVEEIGSEAYAIIENAFLEWNDTIPSDVTLNFMHGECAAIYGVNCVTMIDTAQGYLAHTQQTSRNGIISDSDIMIARGYDYRVSDDQYGYDFRRLMLHEIGHFLASLPHSDDKEDVMYGYFDYDGPTAELNDNNRADMAAMYVAIDEPGCSMAPTVRGSSIFNLIF